MFINAYNCFLQYDIVVINSNWINSNFALWKNVWQNFLIVNL